VEGKSSIHDTSLFRTDVVPVVNDHLRTLELLYLDGVQPGNKGRNYVCRRLLRRVLRYEYPPDLMIDSWLIAEREQRDRRLREGKRLLKRHFGKDDRWWWESVGILPEERAML
jgi:alanyl-tRNA synthetase